MRRLPRQTRKVILILFTTFGAVFVAEIVGDKLFYTTGVLAARYRTMPIMLGMAIAFMAKMGGRCAGRRGRFEIAAAAGRDDYGH